MQYNKILITIVSILLLSCNSQQDAQATEQDDQAQDSTLADADTAAVWSVEYDTLTKKDTIIKWREIDKASITPQILIDILNKNWENLHIDLVKISTDTIFIKIPNSRTQTSSMGTTGVDHFTTAVTYTLTELQGINYVNIDFDEGSDGMTETFKR